MTTAFQGSMGLEVYFPERRSQRILGVEMPGKARGAYSARGLGGGGLCLHTH